MSTSELVTGAPDSDSIASTEKPNTPVTPLTTFGVEPAPRLAVRPSGRRGFAVRAAELVILMTAIVGALALGLGLSDYLSQHRYVTAYLLAYGVFRLADLLVRDEAMLGLDRERFARRVMYEIPLLLLFFAAPFERTYIYGGEAPRWLAALGLLIELAGLWLALGARIQLGFFSPQPAGEARPVLVRGGVYRFIRHPIYAGELIVLLAWPFEYGAPVSLIISAIIVIWVTRRRVRTEEAALLAQFGDEYAGYMQVTDRLIPNVW